MSTVLVAFTNKVGKNSRYFVGVFNETIIPLALIGYEMIIATRRYVICIHFVWCKFSSNNKLNIKKKKKKDEYFCIERSVEYYPVKYSLRERCWKVISTNFPIVLLLHLVGLSWRLYSFNQLLLLKQHLVDGFAHKNVLFLRWSCHPQSSNEKWLVC